MLYLRENRCVRYVCRGETSCALKEEGSLTAVDGGTVCFLRREPLSLARRLGKIKKTVSISLMLAQSRFSVSFPLASHRQTPSLRFICLPLACSCPIPSPSGSSSTSASAFPRLFRPPPPPRPFFHPAGIPPRSRPARSGSSRSDVNLRSTPSNLRDEGTFFG